MDSRSGRLTWVRADRKNSLLFITLVQKLVQEHPEAKVIHLVLDNFKIHDSLATRAALEPKRSNRACGEKSGVKR